MPESEYRHALPIGHVLRDYRVRDVLGVGGFGVTYLAYHEALAEQVAIKEYLPNEFAVRHGVTVQPKSHSDAATFEWGLERFIDEARTLTRFRHRHVVRVRDCFAHNDTAYIVMDYEEGEALDVLLGKHGTLSEAQLRRLILPVADGLSQVHAAGFLHRDLKPSNIFVRREDESPVLLDFGAARQALGHKSKTITAVVSSGYSPPEQYEADGEQAVYTDIYALSALCHRAIIGRPPPDAARRVNAVVRHEPDPLPSLLDTVPTGYSRSLLEAIDRGLRCTPKERPQDLTEWLALFGTDVADPPVAEANEKEQPRRGEVDADAGEFASRRDRQTPKHRRRRGALAIACCAMLVLASVAVWHAVTGDDGEPRLPGPAVPPGADTPERSVVYGTLTVDTVPPDATVKVLAQDEPYRPGMRLPEGRYELAVSREGHRPEVREVHVSGSTQVRIQLQLADGMFTIVASPEDAVVQFLDVDELYRAGMTLPPDQYRIRVSAPGYQTVNETLRHGEAETRHRVSLLRVRQPFTVTAVPEDAEIRIAGHDEDYRAEMMVPWGEYSVTVSAPGYLNREQTVVHEADRPTNLRVTLEQFPVPEMVVVRGGRFEMGCVSAEGCYDDEKPVHEVTVASFELAKYETTFEEYDVFAQTTGRQQASDGGWGRGRRPVINVTWFDALEYARWLSVQTGERYRLPTEAEWEYAARSGTKSPYPWGRRIGKNHANCAECGGRRDKRTTVVGSFEANPWGLHDTHGNVWEWTADCWHPGYAGAPTDGGVWDAEDCEKRVMRGGSWRTPRWSLRSAFRLGNIPEIRLSDGGFRVARTPPQ